MVSTPTLWKAPTQVNTSDAAVAAGGTAVQEDGQIVGLPDGGYVVVWTDGSRAFNPHGTTVVAQQYDVLGEKVGGEVSLRDTPWPGAAQEDSPATTLLPIPSVPGTYWVAVAYVDRYDDPDPLLFYHGIYVEFYDPVLHFHGGADVFLTLTAPIAFFVADPSITAFGDGSYVISYTAGVAGNTDVVARMRQTDGTIGPQFDIHNEGDASGASELATLLNGNFVAVYQDEFNGSSTDTDIKFRIFTATGTAVTASNPVLGGNGGAAETDPDVAALSGGGFAVVWTDAAGDGDGEGIRATIHNNSGGVVQGDLQINASTAGNQNEASVVALADGSFVVTWEDDGADMVRARRFDAAGNSIGVEFTVRNGTSVDSPETALLDDGRFAYAVGDVSGGDPDVTTSIWDPRTSPINGTAGDDAITSRRDGAVVHGLAGNDTLFGLEGVDTLNGGGGNDTLDGGAGSDTGTFGASRAQYDVRTAFVGGLLRTTVAHQGGSATDGTDTLTAIEQLSFADRTVALAGAQLNHVSNLAGTRFDDVLFQSAATGQVLVANMWGGGFNGWSAGTAAMGADWKAVGAGDVNPGPAGGAEIFVQQQSSGTIYYASRDSGATAWGVVSASLTADWKLRAVADVDGDASADAIIQNQTSGTTYYADMQGGVFQSWNVVTATVNSDWVAAGAGDINRDGFADVVFQQQSTGTTYYADMTGGAFVGWAVVTANITPDWKAKAMADVNGDGFADVIFQSQSTGTTYFTNMANGVFSGWGVVAQNTGPTWLVEGVADVNNDGFRDVLFQHTSDGSTYYAEMSAGGFAHWGTVAANITSDYHVV